MAAAGDVLRPGIHAVFAYTPHETDVKCTVSCVDQRFVSVDDASNVALWGLSSGPVNKAFPKIKKLLNISATGSQHGIITQLLYVSKSRQFFAACLDDTLKLYNEQFCLQASFRWHGGVVTNMLYNSLYDELITVGRNGVKAWYCEADYKAFAKNSAAPLNHGSRAKQQLGNSATSASKLKGGKAPPWELGAFQSVRERVTFRVPGANQHRVPRAAGLIKQADWCQQAFLQEDLQVLYVPIKGSVYGFRIDTGERINNWEAIHKQLVTAVVHPPGTHHIITGSHDMTAKLWALESNGELQFMQMFTQTASPIQSISLHPSQQSILMAVADGTISLWQLDTLGEVYRYKHEGFIQGLTFTDTDDFFFFSGRAVCAMRLQHLFKPFRSCNSQPRQLDLLADGSLLMSFEDGCVRIWDPVIAADITVTLPQLSIRSPRYVRVDLFQRKVYVLLSNGHIHVWKMHDDRAPTLIAVWDKLTPNHKDLALSIALVPRGSLSPKLAELQGLTLTADGQCSDHVVVGTRAGDCLFLDAVHGGQIMLCFPAHRGDPVDLLAIDAGRQRMVTTSGDLLKVWHMRGHRVLRELRFSERLTHIEVMGEVAVLGGQAGGVHLVNMDTGELLVSPKMEDHDGPVTGLSAHATLRHFISAGSDGLIKVYDRRKRLKRTMHLLEPIFSVSFLNDKGDIVAALGQKLVVIRADSYALLTAEEMAMLVTEHIKPQQQSLNAGATQQSSMQLVSNTSSKRPALARQPTLAQVSDKVQLSGLSTQLSMAQALMQPEMLQHLQSLGSDARVSIFDDTITKPEVSPVAVVAKLATAAKSWQRFKSPDSQTQSSGPQAAIDSDEGAQAAATLKKFSKPVGGADDANECVTAPGSIQSAASCIPGRSAAAVATAVARGVNPALLSSNANTGSGSAAGHKVGFAEPEFGNTADISAAWSALGDTADMSAAGESGDTQVEEANLDEQQASAAEMRAQLAAGIRRAATHSTPSLHQTLRRLNKELIEADQSMAASPALSSRTAASPRDRDQTASVAGGGADSAAVPSNEGQTEQDENSGSESSAASDSDSSSGREQGEVAGLSSFMAKALKVVSAPDAFLHREPDPRPPALPCFSFSRRGTLVKTMSRKRSLGRLQSVAGDKPQEGSRGVTKAASLPGASKQDQQASTPLQIDKPGQLQQQQQQQAGFTHEVSASNAQQPVLGQQGAALASIPEDESVRGQDDTASSGSHITKKKRKKRKVKRRSKLSQLGGMTDQEKSVWLLEHCKAGEVITGLLEYQEAISMTRAASKGLALKTHCLAVKTPAFPISQVKLPQTFQASQLD